MKARTHLKIVGLALIAAPLLFLAPTTHAQIPTLIQTQQPRPLTLIITWRAQSLVPRWYKGAALAARGSAVTAVVQAISGNRPVTINDKMIQWTVGGTPVAQGVGKTSFSFTVDAFASGSYNISAKVTDGSQVLGQAATEMPIVSPEVVISIPYPNNEVPRDGAVLQALQYFFNRATDDGLNFQWVIGTFEVPNNAQFGNLLATSFSTMANDVPVTVTVRNPDNVYEQTKSITHINIQ